MDPITDATLNGWENGTIPTCQAYINAIDALRPLTPDQRAEAIAEGHTRGNYLGGRPSSNIAAACLTVAVGRTPYRDQANADRQAQQRQSMNSREHAYNVAMRHLSGF